jgi:hypothetical protein
MNTSTQRVGIFGSSLALLLLGSAAVRADVFAMPPGQTSLLFSVVGDAGNAADTAVMSDFTSGYGAVDHAYQIGKYDVTVAQYTQFLNAVADDDTYDLYSPAMEVLPSNFAACGITRGGSPGSYVYAVATEHDNYPVNNVSWADAARFTNWLHNGQPTGPQGPATTERGAYTLDGANTDPALVSIARDAGAKYVLPNEDEWYKAAYYKGGGPMMRRETRWPRPPSIVPTILSSTIPTA